MAGRCSCITRTGESGNQLVMPGTGAMEFFLLPRSQVQNLGIGPAGQVLIPSVDAVKDIRKLPCREEVKGRVSAGLGR
jgi:hypothetical protein